MLNSGIDPLDYFRRTLGRQGAVLVRHLPLINAVTCHLPARASVMTLRGQPEVSRVDYDFLLRIETVARPQLASISAGQEVPWGIERIRAPQVWQATDGSGVRIGVIDTGIDLTHPDLQQNIAGGTNILDPGQPPVDDNGHGTHVAGTIAALNNGIGVVGGAPGARIFAIKAFDQNGTARLSDVIAALEWCLTNNISVINLSFGSDTGNESFRDAVRAAARSTVLVAAAGNNGRADSVDVPARYPDVVAVSASTRADQLAAFSSRGPQVAVAAPGQDILSTWTDGGYSTLSGTSMATPHVTALYALLMRYRPGLSRAQMLEIIRRTADPLIGVAQDGGSGVINAANVITAFRPGWVLPAR
ncbi:MAG: S8 family peptidase [Chloroflexota bacterium]